MHYLFATVWQHGWKCEVQIGHCVGFAAQVQFADTKATFILGANSALVSYLFSTPLVRDAGQIASLATALRMMCLACLLFSSYYVLKVVRPRLVTFQDKVSADLCRHTLSEMSLLLICHLNWLCGDKGAQAQTNYLFFEHIVKIPLQEYVAMFQSIAQTQEMTDLLVGQVWANAQVATLKCVDIN